MSVTTIARVKARLDITSATHDAVLTDIVDGLTAAFEGICDRDLVRVVDRVERHDGGLGGLGRAAIGPLPALPIESVAEIKESANPVDFAAATALTVETDYYVDAAAGLIHRLPSGAAWLIGRANVQVKYTGGFVAAGGTPSGFQVGMPADLIEAATRQAVEWFRTRGKPGTESLSAGGGSVHFAHDDLLPDVRRALERYRRYAG